MPPPAVLLAAHGHAAPDFERTLARCGGGAPVPAGGSAAACFSSAAAGSGSGSGGGSSRGPGGAAGSSGTSTDSSGPGLARACVFACTAGDCTLGAPCVLCVSDAADPTQVLEGGGREQGRGVQPRPRPGRGAAAATPACQGQLRPRSPHPPSAPPHRPPLAPTSSPRTAQGAPRAARDVYASTGLRAFAQVVMGAPECPVGSLLFASRKPGAFADPTCAPGRARARLWRGPAAAGVWRGTGCSNKAGTAAPLPTPHSLCAPPQVAAAAARR
jgi:hypothetical protein